MKRISFDDSSAVIEIPDCPELLATLHSAAPDWSCRETDRAGEPVCVIRKLQSSYEILAPGEEPVEVSVVGAACSVLVDAVDGLMEARPEQLFLHCGSVLMNGRLVIFPSHSHAGKSTLVARLASAGYMVFGDDVLPLTDDDNEGAAIGIAPRLRIPLPQHSSGGFRSFVEGNKGPGDDRYQFLDLGKDGLARRGRKAPLGAIVLLDRSDEGPAFLSTVSRSTVLQTLINQNFSAEANGVALIDRLHRLMDKVPVLALNYSRLDDALGLLEDCFAAWPARLGSLVGTNDAPPPLVRAGDEDILEVEGADAIDLPPPETIMRRKDGIEMRQIEAACFLASQDQSIVYHLNATGAAVWNFLSEPASRLEIYDALCLAFPQAESGAIKEDVAALFKGLMAAGLIEPVCG